MLFLEEFWNGNISPGEGRYHSKKEYKDAWSLVERLEDQLKERLSPEHWELFTQYQDAEGKIPISFIAVWPRLSCRLK